MSTHTPGPWHVDTAGHPNADVRAACGRAVAFTWMVCCGTPKTSEQYKARTEIDRANARLIAAAPEMLEALQGLFGADMESVMMGHGHHDQVEAIAKARAAIAKAEGRS